MGLGCMSSRTAISTAITATSSVIPNARGRSIAAVRSSLRFLSGVVTRQQLVYETHGDPAAVLSLKADTVDLPKADEVGVKFLAAPINPADLNQIEGVYPKKPPLPAVGGNEGVGVISHVGKNIKLWKEGDWVIPLKSGFGTWRTYAVGKENDFISVPSDIPAPLASTLSVNPCTAYRMLRDFVKLEKGDVVVQNAATSAVGQAVIQLAREMGVITINIVRERPNMEETVSYLKSIGANVVVSEEFTRTPEMATIMNAYPRGKLGFNCVGGKYTANVIRLLGNNSTLVTYGGMSRQPVTIPTGSLIFNNITCAGFWMTRWNEICRPEERHTMLQELANLVRLGKLSLPYETHPLANYKIALSNATSSFKKNKQIFIMDG